MSEALHLVLRSPEQAKNLIGNYLGPYCRQLWEAGVQGVTLTAQPEEDAKTEQQRRYYHGVVLTEIAEQAVANGQKFPMPVWKEHFRKTFLGSKRVRFTNPITGRKSWRMERISTEGLGVRAYSELIEKVTAFAATELGVEFSHHGWEDYKQ